MVFGNRVRGLREDAEMTQAGLATAIGTSRPAIAMWETDKTYPTVAGLMRLAEFFDVTTDWLLYGDD